MTSLQLGGPWAQQLPDPPLQGRYSRIVAQAKDADANPHLARDRHGRVWFVPKAAIAAPVGLLLPAQVNAILADPDTIIRLGVAHPHTGAVEQLDERTYRPGAKLARLVRARDGTCRYPGCATPPARCDLDHVIAYPAGATSAANLQTLCRTHHGFKHHGGWTVTMTPEGVCTWTAPNGPHPHHPPPRPPRRRRLAVTPRAANLDFVCRVMPGSIRAGGRLGGLPGTALASLLAASWVAWTGLPAARRARRRSDT